MTMICTCWWHLGLRFGEQRPIFEGDRRLDLPLAGDHQLQAPWNRASARESDRADDRHDDVHHERRGLHRLRCDFEVLAVHLDIIRITG